MRLPGGAVPQSYDDEAHDSPSEPSPRDVQPAPADATKPSVTAAASEMSTTDTEPALPAGRTHGNAVPGGAEAHFPDLDAESAVDGAELDQEELLNFPWDSGHPPLVARLLDQDRDALSVLVADAAAESDIRRQLLRLSCAAYLCEPQALEGLLPLLLPADSDLDKCGVDENRLLLAACLRIGLTLGYPPMGLPSLVDRSLLADTGLQEVVDAAARGPAGVLPPAGAPGR